MQKEEEDFILPTDEITDFGAFFKDYKAEEKFIHFLRTQIDFCEKNILDETQKNDNDIDNKKLNNETRKLAFYSLSLNRVYFENMLFVKNGIQSKNIDKFNKVFDRCLTQCKKLYDQKVDVRAAAAEQPQDGDDISILNLGDFEGEPELMLYLKFIIKTHLENLFVFFPTPPAEVEDEYMYVHTIKGGSAVIPNSAAISNPAAIPNLSKKRSYNNNNNNDEMTNNNEGNNETINAYQVKNYNGNNEGSNVEFGRSRKKGRVYGPVLDDEDTNSEENDQPVLEKYDDADEGDDGEPGDLNTNIPPPRNEQNVIFHQNIARIISRCCTEPNVRGNNFDIDDWLDDYFVRQQPVTGGKKKRTHKKRKNIKKKKPSEKPKTRKRKT